MKTLATFLFLVGTASSLWGAEKLTFGLDRKADSVRRKIPLIIYVGNDTMAPTNAQEMSNSASYLMAGFEGKQWYLGTKVWFTQAELDSYFKLPEADREFLKLVGTYFSTDISETTVGMDDQVFREGICRPNAKYKAALVTLRNFRQNGPIATKRGGFRWDHCGANVERESTMLRHETDVTKLGDSVYAYPYDENPVTHAGLLAAAVTDLVKIYPPEEYRYLILVHSVSRGDLVLPPQYPVGITGLPIEKLRREVLDARDQFHVENGKIKKDRSFFTVMNSVVAKVAPEAKFEAGISAKDFLQMFDGIAGASVSAVVFDGNALDVSSIKNEKFPRIGTVFYGTEAAPEWRVYAWERLFKSIGVTATDLEDRLFELMLK